MGLTLLGALSPFPIQGDPLSYKSQSRRLSQLKNLPWSLDVFPTLHTPQLLPRFRLCTSQVCLEDALQSPNTPALSDTGVSGDLMPCTVEEPLAGWVSLDLNALCLVRSGTQTCPLPSGWAYTGASR